jgi:hypothetical protein
MHSVNPAVSAAVVTPCNDLIARFVDMFPERFVASRACRSTWTRPSMCAQFRVAPLRHELGFVAA